MSWRSNIVHDEALELLSVKNFNQECEKNESLKSDLSNLHKSDLMDALNYYQGASNSLRKK